MSTGLPGSCWFGRASRHCPCRPPAEWSMVIAVWLWWLNAASRFTGQREARYRRVECGAFPPEMEFCPQRGSHPSPVKHTLGSADMLGIVSCWPPTQRSVGGKESCPPPEISLTDTIAQLYGALCPGTNVWGQGTAYSAACS